GSFKYIILMNAFVIQMLSEPTKAVSYEKSIIASIFKIISKCQEELPPEERNITLRVKCIGVETEDGNVEKLTKKQMALRFGTKNTQICGSMATKECQDVAPPTGPPKTKTTLTTRISTTPTSPPPLPTQPFPES
ncbi:unnamed protein product, partial [Owenia fusiformis]